MKQKFKIIRGLIFLAFYSFLEAGDLQTPISSLNDEELDTFILGKSFFHIPWVEAPSATTARDGLGPLFSSNTCVSCHPKNGKGAVYNKEGKLARSLVTRLSIQSDKKTKSGFMPEPTYGGQLSINAIHGVKYEGKPTRTYTHKTIILEGGEKVILNKPICSIMDLQYGPLSKKVIISQRVPPPLIGLGLLQQLKDEQILANEDIDDKIKDGISGKANRVLNNKLGRYNWKANAPTVKYQVAAAMHNDMGLTTPIFPNENCTKVQKECLDSPKGRDEYDIPMKRLDAITFYLKHLKTPKTKENKSGLKIFKQLSCASCHIPTFKLDDGKIIHPFSDLLLHDMGKDLADGRVEFQATGSEFKTPPLWGISIYKNILKDRVNFLHDGRAKTLQEAILWHSGEAENSKNNFIKLAPNKRKILIDFLERL
jgi:CxxC motif-containing protein (DUF1111 family)